MDSFDLLGVPARFDLEPAAVRAAFLRKIAAAHPDRAGGAGVAGASFGFEDDDEEAGPAGRAEGVGSAGTAERLNAAKLELENPETRAAALLRRLSTTAGVVGTGKDDDRTLPAGFLMEMMETRERIDAELDGAVKRGTEAARQTLTKWEAWAGEQRAQHLAEVGKLFAQITGAGESASSGGSDAKAALKAVRTRMNAWRYVERLVEQLRERALGGGGGL